MSSGLHYKTKSSLCFISLYFMIEYSALSKHNPFVGQLLEALARMPLQQTVPMNPVSLTHLVPSQQTSQDAALNRSPTMLFFSAKLMGWGLQSVQLPSLL